jgi:hypothetical protein
VPSALPLDDTSKLDLPGGTCRTRVITLPVESCGLAHPFDSPRAISPLRYDAEYRFEFKEVGTLWSGCYGLLHFADLERLPGTRMPMVLVRRGSEGTEPKPRRSYLPFGPDPDCQRLAGIPQPARRTETTATIASKGPSSFVATFTSAAGPKRVNVRVMESLR